MSVSVDGNSVYNRTGRGFAISRIPYRNEYITQYQEPYDTALGYQYLMILTDNASTESEAYGECTIAHNSDGTRQVTLAFTANCTYSASIGTANGSVVLSLPAIPRITTPNVSAVTLGSAATITLTPRRARSFIPCGQSLARARRRRSRRKPLQQAFHGRRRWTKPAPRRTRRALRGHFFVIPTPTEFFSAQHR